jgi:hypothetical protein
MRSDVGSVHASTGAEVDIAGDSGQCSAVLECKEKVMVCQDDPMRSVEPRRKCLGIPASDLSAGPSSYVATRHRRIARSLLSLLPLHAVTPNTATGQQVDKMVREDLVTSAVSPITPGQ